MTTAAISAPFAEASAARVARADSPARASDVLRDEVQLWIWERRLRDPLREAVGEVAQAGPFDVRRALRVADRREQAEALLADAGVPGGRPRTVVAQDVASLLFLHSRLVGATRLGVRLTCADQGACRLFHADHVSLRLLCTYVGPGTEWVPEHAVRRHELGLQGRDVPRANAAIVAEPGAVQALGTGHVAVLKGETYPGNAGRGAVHRSPGATARRLLLVIDPVTGR